MKKDLVIKFDNEKALKHFASWLCESGEQEYWEWMKYRESEEDGDITVISFYYHGEDGKSKFLKDNIIRTKCGRIEIK
jgi:hypothetical protein